jgi:biopolymer transport protein ExbD
MADKPKRKLDGKIAIDMTPMIDIVFQLLTFFCMTLKVASAEGDFQIRMPLTQVPGPPRIDAQPPIHVYLRSNPAGECTRVVLGEHEFSGPDRWNLMHRQLASIVGEGDLAQQAEVQLHCDAQLKYEHAMAAITAISGRVNPDDGRIIKLVEKINFAQ